jgi:two-component system, OmpR family, response regulator
MLTGTEHQPKDEQKHSVDGLSVLIVEDNFETARALAELLTAEGCAVQTAFDGASALRALGEATPDVVLLDIGLPGLSGYEVARRIAQTWGPQRKAPFVVALTGRGGDEARRQSEAAGVDLHLVKPADPDALRALLGRVRDFLERSNL